MRKGLFFRCEDWDIVSIEGPEAQNFLHRITSADFKNLHVGQGLSGALLAATGKLIVYFEAIHHKLDGYLLAVPPGLAADAPSAFETLHFMEKLQIRSVKNDWRFFRLLLDADRGADPITSSASRFAFPLQQWTVDRWPSELRAAAATTGFLPVQDMGFFLPAAQRELFLEQLAGAGIEESASEFYRIASLSPAAGKELTTATIPLEAGLGKAIAENKGCYPGQEVIERIRAIGQTAKVLSRVLGRGQPPAIGAAVQAMGAEAGALTSVESIPSDIKNGMDWDWIALGYVRRAAIAAPSFQAEGREVSVSFARTGAARE